MINVNALRGITLRSKDVEQSARFYEDVWGLSRIDSGSGSGAYFKGTGSEPCVLGLEPGDGRGVVALRLGLASNADVDSAFHELSQAGVSCAERPRVLPISSDYYGFHFTDPDGNCIELSALNDFGAVEDEVQFVPEKLSHMVFNSPDNKRLRDFYIEKLGMKLADWYAGDAFFFLRCNEQHHVLGIEACDNVSLNHMAFHIADLDAMMRFVGRMSNAGYEPLWGPGRHGPGGNCFCYFSDPDGYVIEITSELIEIADSDSWEPKEWIPGPDNANVWGTGGRTEEAVKLMSGG